MRAGFALVLVASLWAGGAMASSVVIIAPPDGPSPSIIDLRGRPTSLATFGPDAGGPKVVMGGLDGPDRHMTFVDGDGVALSRSVVSMGLPGVAPEEEVAAIKGEQPGHMPTIIRGGMSGDASPAAPVTVTTGFDRNLDAQAPVQPGPVEPAEAARPAVAPQAPAAARPPEFDARGE